MKQFDITVSVPVHVIDNIKQEYQSQFDKEMTDEQLQSFIEQESDYWFSGDCSEFEDGLGDSITNAF